MARGAGEGPTGPSQGEELAGLGTDEAGDPEAVIEGVAAVAAAGADGVEALQADGASGG